MKKGKKDMKFRYGISVQRENSVFFHVATEFDTFYNKKLVPLQRFLKSGNY